MDEKELRAKVSHERTQYGLYNPDYVHFEETTEEFVSIGEMDDTPPPDDSVEIILDNSWNVVNNLVLKNSLRHDTTILSKIDMIAASNAQTPPSNVTYRNIALVREYILAKKMLSFSEANKAGTDTSSFNIDFSFFFFFVEVCIYPSYTLQTVGLYSRTAFCYYNRLRVDALGFDSPWRCGRNIIELRSVCSNQGY